jgi:hypothetical protein
MRSAFRDRIAFTQTTADRTISRMLFRVVRGLADLYSDTLPGAVGHQAARGLGTYHTGQGTL